jgi:hypothetical protein
MSSDSTIVGANLRVPRPLEVKKGCGIRGVGGVADKGAYNILAGDIIFQRQYFVVRCLL